MYYGAHVQKLPHYHNDSYLLASALICSGPECLRWILYHGNAGRSGPLENQVAPFFDTHAVALRTSERKRWTLLRNLLKCVPVPCLVCEDTSLTCIHGARAREAVTSILIKGRQFFTEVTLAAQDPAIGEGAAMLARAGLMAFRTQGIITSFAGWMIKHWEGKALSKRECVCMFPIMVMDH